MFLWITPNSKRQGDLLLKILLAGSWEHEFYEEACAQALSSLNANVIRYEWKKYFKGLIGRLQGKFPMLRGNALLKLNYDLVRFARRCSPECILIWRGIHLLPQTVRILKQRTGALIVSYNNDDPFGPQQHGNVPWHHHYYWRNYLKCIPEFDVHFVYRRVNLDEICRAGAKRAHILMPYFVPDIHRPMRLTERDTARYGCDVVYVGHYEPDGRIEYLRALVDTGLHVRLFGGDNTWTPKVLGDMGRYFGKIHPVYGDDYAKALCGAQICLCFLSRINRDTYTRRCFEIPACGRLLLSERTDDLKMLFKEDEEAVFFSSKEELVEKAFWLQENPGEVNRIAAAGMKRVIADGHSVDDRMREFLAAIQSLTT